MPMTQQEIDIREDERQRYELKVLEALVCTESRRDPGLSSRIADHLGLAHVYQMASADYEESGCQWDDARLLALLNEKLEPGERWREYLYPKEGTD